ncbi:dmX 2 isoform X2, putative [Babesia ovis]|uniref:DmX 2 isoform X2, putative n=1 Tax=Babesia ovis TaxID=5869 RepID=A0A9W5WWI1_BABOV|nr:dmX 2 isoform X2, putative [Babesia ovis]
MPRGVLTRKVGYESPRESDHGVTYLDILTLWDRDAPDQLEPTKFAAALLHSSIPQYRGISKPSETTLYLFPLDIEDDVIKWFSVRRAGRSSGGDSHSLRLRVPRPSAPVDLWALQHKSKVINAAWNRASSGHMSKLLVSITDNMLAHIWCVGPTASSYTMLVQIDIGEQSFGPSVTSCWIDMGPSVHGTVFKEKEYIIFHEVVEGAPSTIVSNDKPVPCNFKVQKDGDKSGSHPKEATGYIHRCTVHRQHFKIFAIHGINNANGKIDACCMLSHQDMFLPLQIQRIISAEVCGHTMKSGVITLYAPETLRPNKVTPRCSFQMSKWITMTSRSITPPISDEFHDDILGTQVALGLHKFVPPCTINVTSDLGLSIQILLTPCDLFLKDCHIDANDNVIGLVGRYLCHAHTPQFISPPEALANSRVHNTLEGSPPEALANSRVHNTLEGSSPEALANSRVHNTLEGSSPEALANSRVQNTDEVILERFRSAKGVLDVCSVYDNEWFLCFILHKTGKIELYRAICYNHVISQRTPIVVPDISRVRAIKVLKHCEHILIAMFVIDSTGITRFNIYEWSLTSISLRSSWVFRDLPEVDYLIQDFNLWYDQGPLYLVTRCILETSDVASGDGTHIYLIEDNDMVHWLTIANGSLHDLVAGEQRQLTKAASGVQYSLKDDKLVCHLEKDQTIDVTIADGTEAKAEPLPIYHPRYLSVFLELGMRKFVDELVIALVKLYRTFLTKLSEPGSCAPLNSSLYGCNCVIAKVKNLDLFTDFNRFQSLRFLQTFATLIQANPSQLVGDLFCDNNPDNNSLDNSTLNYGNPDNNTLDNTQDGIPINELRLFLQHLRLPGLAWAEQIELMHLVEDLRPKSDPDQFASALVSPTPMSSGMDTLSNFMRMSEVHHSKEYLVDDVIDFRLSTEPEPTEDLNATTTTSVCPLVRKAQNLLKSGDDEKKVKMWRMNDELVGLTLPPKITTDDLCLSRCIDSIKHGHDDENHLVWAVLYRDDHNLFSTMLSMLNIGDDLAVCKHLLSNMKNVGLGYWLSSPASLDNLCSTLERGFRKLISVTDTGCGVEVFDEFGFWSIIRGKPLVYGCVLKAKGFQKLGEFLSNNFTEERWINAAVKNAYALIAQKRYLLAAGFLALAGRITDAVDVCFQYMDDPQLACLICRLCNHDLGYVLGLMKASRIKDILEYKTCSKRGDPIEVHTVEHLVYYLYTCVRFNHADVSTMIETTKKCANSYRALGMPIVALALNSLILTNEVNRWKALIAQGTLQYLRKNTSAHSSLHDCLRVLQELCGETINRLGSNVSDYGSDICDRGFSDLRASVSDLDVASCEDVLIFPESNDDSTVGIGYMDGFQLYVIMLINRLKLEYTLEVTSDYGLSRTSLSVDILHKVWSMPNYFSYLGKLCIGFFEGQTSIDGSLMLSLILRAIVEGRNDFLSCLILSISSLLTIGCFDRGDMGQIYDAIIGQLVVLNSLLNNQGSGNQFLACLLRTIEPLCFGSQAKILEPQCINLLNFIDNAHKHAFFGICVGTSVLETLLGICRNWIYKAAEHADSLSQTWVDHILYSASRYFYCHVKIELIEDALNAAGIAYPMLSLRVGLDAPVDCKVENEELHVYDSFLERYVASVYGTDFEKLWRFLHCGLRTASVFNRHVHHNRFNVDSDDKNKTICADPPSQEPIDAKASPLVMPLFSMFTLPQTWNQEFVVAQSRIPGKHRNEHIVDNGDIIVLDALRSLRFKALHTFKGRLVSTLYSMMSTTICEELKGLTSNSIIGPVLNDFYMMAILNVPGSVKLSSLSDELSTTVSNVIYASINDTRPCSPSYALYVKLVRIMYIYCKNHMENIFAMKRTSRLSVFAGKIYNYFHTCSDSKDHFLGGPSGGICGHPRWPLYAVVYGENQPGQMPAYNVSLQHPVSLMNGYRDALGDSGCNEEIIYDRVTGKRMNVGQGSVFGDLTSVAWSGDWLSVLDTNGWLLVYNTRNMVHMNGEDAEIAIPSIFFRPHTTAVGSNWLSESYIATIGCGISPEMITTNVVIIDTKVEDMGSHSTSSLSNVPSSLHNESTDSFSSKNDTEHLSRALTEMKHPCVCIWDLVDVHKNNSPKLKVVLANGSTISHSIFNKKKSVLSPVRFTCMLPIPTMQLDIHGAPGLDHDIILFDSLGSMMLFSSASHEVTVTCQAHSCAVVKCFNVGNNIVTVAQDGGIAMFRYNGIFSEPTRVFEGVAESRMVNSDALSNASLVASIGEYLGIKFVDTGSRETVAGAPSSSPDIVDAQIVQNRFLVLTTSDGTATVTELPC